MLHVGDVFGQLTVARCVGVIRGRMSYEVRCACGSTMVSIGSELIRTNRSHQCVACGRANAKRKAAKHRMVGSPEYGSWMSMMGRCSNPHDPAYARYGGRGILVCGRWKDFRNFYSDMGPRPEGMTLDRIDNDRGYEPANCRWADRFTQSRNRRGTKFYDVAGGRHTALDLAKLSGLPYDCVRKRLYSGWSPEDAITIPQGAARP